MSLQQNFQLFLFTVLFFVVFFRAKKMRVQKFGCVVIELRLWYAIGFSLSRV